MPLPEPFSDVEHLQAVVRRYLNKQIREDFRDLFGDGDTWEPEISTTRGSMLRALLHEDSDPITVTAVRMMLYYFTYGRAKALQPDIYGTSITSQNRVIRAKKPEITLYFNNKPYQLNKDNKFVEGQISFRLMDKTYKTITMVEIETYARKIKSLFATPKFIWHKGKEMVSYTDWEMGYQLQLLVRDKVEGKRIIEQVLDIQGHTPEWDLMQHSKNEDEAEAYPENPRSETILGKTVEGLRKRPKEEVVFRYATLTMRGRARGINLVDTTFSRAKAIERVV